MPEDKRGYASCLISSCGTISRLGPNERDAEGQPPQAKVSPDTIAGARL
jgi:hypothetical protein